MSEEALRTRCDEAAAHRLRILTDTPASPEQVQKAHIQCLMAFVKSERVLDLQWTTERPTIPGWYWYRQDQGSVPVVMMIHPYRPETFWLTFPGEWAGPLEIPK